MKRYVNPQLGIAFEYPSDWLFSENCKIRLGVDVLLSNRFSNFGIVKVSEELKENCTFLNYNNLDMQTQLSLILKSSMQKNEMIVEDVRLDKYEISNSNTATLLLHRWDKRMEANMIMERTLLAHSNDKTEYYTIAFETLSEEYASVKCRNELRRLIESIMIV